MYIEFELAKPNDVMVRLVAWRSENIIDQALEAWSQQYQTAYKTKTVKYRKRVTFDSDESYTLFAMTWNTERKYQVLSKWRIVSDLNNKI